MKMQLNFSAKASRKLLAYSGALALFVHDAYSENLGNHNILCVGARAHQEKRLLTRTHMHAAKREIH